MSFNNIEIKAEKSLTALYKLCGFSYLGGIATSAKMKMSYRHNVATYCIYLAPADMSGYNVCPNNKYCRQFCLNASGHNKADILAHGIEESKTNKARIRKTRLFYENREVFMTIMVMEILKGIEYAKKHNMEFAVRINGTSDLSPELFKYNGVCILDLFPNVQFYDYTKVYNRIKLMSKYKNYDLTLSYNGFNWNDCERFMNEGGRAAVVFEGELPKAFKHYRVIDGNTYDMRYMDDNGVIVGLHYHPVASDFVNGHYVSPNTPFVIRQDNPNSVF